MGIHANTGKFSGASLWDSPDACGVSGLDHRAQGCPLFVFLCASFNQLSILCSKQNFFCVCPYHHLGVIEHAGQADGAQFASRFALVRLVLREENHRKEPAQQDPFLYLYHPDLRPDAFVLHGPDGNIVAFRTGGIGLYMDIRFLYPEILLAGRIHSVLSIPQAGNDLSFSVYYRVDRCLFVYFIFNPLP